MNRVELIGRLTKDPELRYTPNGIATATITLAVDRLPDKEGNKKTDFINVVVWNKQAENVNKYVFKGSLVSVEGKIATRSFDSQNGEKKWATEVICDRIQFLENKKKNDSTKLSGDDVDNYQEENNPFAEVDDSQLPF